MGQRVIAAIEEMSILTNGIDVKIDTLKAEVKVLKLAVGRDEDRAPISKFKVTKVPDVEKVSITSMYLIGEAKLWRRYRLLDDASTNREKIETWEVLNKKLKDQFLFCNTSWVARESLRKLRHTGTVREFVKEFSSLMLDVRDMSEEDKLFKFMADFKVVNNLEQRHDDFGNDKAKFGKKFRRKEKAKKVVIETFEPRTVEKPRGGCFICGNLEHRARNCLKRGKLNVIVAEQTDDDSETEQIWVGALQLGVLQAQFRVYVESHYKGLMMVAGQINDEEMKALVDTGATNNFISNRVIYGLGLDVKPCDSGNKPTFVRGSMKETLKQERNLRLLRQDRRMSARVSIPTVLVAGSGHWCKAAGCAWYSVASVGRDRHKAYARVGKRYSDRCLCWCHGTRPVDGTWHDTDKVKEWSGDGASRLHANMRAGLVSADIERAGLSLDSVRDVAVGR
ncbi:UNVERIFIED_CONTAM: hypothetical protein Sradi_3277600 [Sesamum radiatum]|uniref:Retrotransposon gag domain-containing protein n=1 Tax=Sesamum radiatum TaxID=300843 RepID=A0AAW2R180_SESRA